VLTAPRPGRRARQHRSLRQEYSEFILQRIEEYKNQLSRDQLVAIADEAVKELEDQQHEQLLLTEVLLLEHVDRIIQRRLNLPTYRRWRTRHLRLRRAQQQPTHWGLRPDAPVASLATSLDEGEALVVGGAALPAAFLLLAHEWPVVFIAPELSVVEAAETRAATESLGARFQALVVHPGTWFPDIAPLLTVLDPQILADVEAGERDAFVDAAKQKTPRGGVHCLLPPPPLGEARALGAEVVRGSYEGWQSKEWGTTGDRRWAVFVKP
jgi:hypothetical protein